MYVNKCAHSKLVILIIVRDPSLHNIYIQNLDPTTENEATSLEYMHIIIWNGAFIVTLKQSTESHPTSKIEIGFKMVALLGHILNCARCAFHLFCAGAKEK